MGRWIPVVMNVAEWKCVWNEGQRQSDKEGLRCLRRIRYFIFFKKSCHNSQKEQFGVACRRTAHFRIIGKTG